MDMKILKQVLTRVAIIGIGVIVVSFVGNLFIKDHSQNAQERARADSLRKQNEEQERALQAFQIALAESMRIAMEEEKERLYKTSIKVLSVYPSKPNTAGGVDVHTVWKNTSNKVIKYIRFEWVPYNAVGDVVGCRIMGYRRSVGQVTGPIQPGQICGYGYRWSNSWYNNTIKKIKLVGIDIEYMDGTTLVIPEEYIESVYKKQDF